MNAARPAVRDQLRSAGLRATKERIKVLGYLQNFDEPISANELSADLKKDLHQATVYRSLDDLENVGLVRRIEFSMRTPRFEYANRHHHHIVCRSCGTVEDISVCLPKAAPHRVLSHSKRFRSVDSHTLEFFGTCVSCSL